MDYILDIANEHPYLWGLYAVVLVSPFVCCAAFCVKLKVRHWTLHLILSNPTLLLYVHCMYDIVYV